jgi:carbon storage regulator
MALVLSRRAGETICITAGANRIRVTVRHIEGGQVKIGIDAPLEVKILREELEGRLDPKHYSAIDGNQ